MTTIMKIGLRHLVAVALLAVLGFAPATAMAKYASFVIDAETGRVLHQVNADTRNYPASLTKMMTLYLMFEALEEGRWTGETRIPISARAARQPASRIGFAKGQSISVEDAIYALTTKSANDVASAVAEALGGSERDFALMMTAQARQLGMSRTTFRNASGLPHRGQMSTARDMATLARALLKNLPRYFHYFSTLRFTYGGRTHKNHNELLGSFEGTDGIKTGYIRASGYNLVASVKRGDYRLIGVIFGGKSPKKRDRHMINLLNKGFRHLASGNRSAGRSPESTPAKPNRPTGALARSPRPTPSGRWGVQVGAYYKTKLAYAAAHKAMATAPAHLEDGIVKIVALDQRKRRPLYRARILGISKKDAYRACRALKRHKMHCMELRMRPGDQLAFASN